jgi:hypothetical protein
VWGVEALIEMFVGPLRVNVKVVVQVLGILGVTVVDVMGVDEAPMVAVVGPATVKVAVTVLELGNGPLAELVWTTGTGVVV